MKKLFALLSIALLSIIAFSPPNFARTGEVQETEIFIFEGNQLIEVSQEIQLSPEVLQITPSEVILQNSIKSLIFSKYSQLDNTKAYICVHLKNIPYSKQKKYEELGYSKRCDY